MAPKSLRIEPGLPPELADAVGRTEPVLERVLGDAAARVGVVWEPGEHQDGGDPSARLTLTDAGVARSAEFFDWEFREDLHVRWRFRDLWVEVLDERLRIQRELVHASLAEEGEG